MQDQMDVAMREVIDSTTIQSVGDFLVPVASEPEGLRYVAYARITMVPTSEPAGNGWFKMRVGSAGAGESSISMLTPYDLGLPAVAFHFLEGRLGVLLYPGKLRRPEILKDVDVESFTQQVAVGYGIRLQGQVRFP